MSNGASAHLRMLVGRAATIQASDPWEFGTEHGTGPLLGVIEAEGGDELLVRLRAPIRFHDVEFGRLAVAARHADSPLPEAALRLVPVNMVPVARSDTTPAEAFRAARAWRGWGLVGSLQVTDAADNPVR